MVTALSITAIVVSIFLVLTILLQNSKGGGLTGSLGSMGSTQMFGTRRTSDFLSKATSVFAGILFLICILTEFVIVSTKSSDAKESIIQSSGVEQPAKK